MQCGQLISTAVEDAETDPQYTFEEVDVSEDDSKEEDIVREPISRITTIYQTQLCQFFATQLHDIIFGDFHENERQQEAINEAEKLITFLKNRTGFLIPKGQQANPNTNQNEEFFSFSHLSFQEYFAAFYLSQCWGRWKESDLTKLIASTNDESWIEVWQMAFEESTRYQQAEMLETLFPKGRKAGWIVKVQDVLTSKLSMNPTLKFKYSLRKDYINRCWKKVTNEDTDFILEDPQFRQVINTLWKKDFDSTNFLTESNIESIMLNHGTYTDSRKLDILKLKQLKSLSLTNNDLDEIDWIYELEILKTLNASLNQIEDLSPLKNLSALEQLFIGFNEIKDLTPIKNLKALKALIIYDNPISDFSPLTECDALQLVFLSETQHENISESQRKVLKKNGVKLNIV